MSKEDFMNADLKGRQKVSYLLQMEETDSIVVSMPLEWKYDLQWRHSDGTKEFIEAKDRDCKSTDYPSAMINENKWLENKVLGEHFIVVCTYTDGVALFFRPATMPESGITIEEKYCKKTTIDPTSQKKRGRKLLLNVNDVYKSVKLPKMYMYDEQQYN